MFSYSRELTHFDGSLVQLRTLIWRPVGLVFLTCSLLTCVPLIVYVPVSLPLCAIEHVALTIIVTIPGRVHLYLSLLFSQNCRFFFIL